MSSKQEEFDQLLVKIKKAQRNPSIGTVAQVVLKNGPRTAKTATVWEILNGDKQHHHYQLTLHTIKHTKATGWEFKADRTVTLDNDKEDELGKLSEFLNQTLKGNLPERDGGYKLVNQKSFDDIEAIIKSLESDTSGITKKVINSVFEVFETNPSKLSEVEEALGDADGALVEALAVRANIVAYTNVINRLEQMVESNTASESQYQKLLDANPWLFGSEYSELLSRRKWTRDHNLDYMLRRTTDQYLEIVEIKKPIVDAILKYDSSHDSYYASSELSKVIGQVIRYMEEIEADRFTIVSKDGDDPLKIRSRIIIGRDGDERMRKALRLFNGYLHNVEILTFDQLLRVGRQVIAVFQGQRTPSDKSSLDIIDPQIPADDAIPF